MHTNKRVRANKRVHTNKHARTNKHVGTNKRVHTNKRVRTKKRLHMVYIRLDGGTCQWYSYPLFHGPSLKSDENTKKNEEKKKEFPLF